MLDPKALCLQDSFSKHISPVPSNHREIQHHVWDRLKEFNYRVSLTLWEDLCLETFTKDQILKIIEGLG